MLLNGLNKVGISGELADSVASKMEKYINEIVLFNSAYNLTNTSDHDELVTRHILDSLAGYNAVQSLIGGRTEILVGDIGSGGGLPGIPLAAAFPETQFRLVERMAKRCAFLENCSALLGLKNVKVINSEAEKVAPDSFDIVTFRAFRPLDEKMTKTLLKMTKTGGKLVAYKAKMDSITEEMNGIKKLVPEYDIVKLHVPGLENSERNLVVITKK